MTKTNRVMLPPDLIDKCEDYAARLVEHHERGRHPHAIPWSWEQMSNGELRAWLASRKAAGKLIDIETCELDRWHACDEDPYGLREVLGERFYFQTGVNRFVRSRDSIGWIWEGDLPPDKARAMYRRIVTSVETTIRKDH
jgi:hypothetical protein